MSKQARWRSGWWFAATVAATTLIAVLAVVVARDRSDRPRPADLRNGQAFIQDNLWTTESEQYAVWVGHDGTPYAGKRQQGDDTWAIASLATAPGNPLGARTGDDLHNVYAIAVDALGFVHVIGNMHGDGLRYIRSTAPGDISRWAAATMPGPASEVTYPRLVGLPDGTVQFWHREGTSGDGDLVLHSLDAGSSEWRSVGTIIDGRATGESPYAHRIAVDPRSGTIHLLFEWRTNGDVSSNNDVGYMRSPDGGHTWHRSDGEPLAVPVTHETAEMIVDTPPSGSGLVNDGGLAVDAEGQPHAVVVFAPKDGPSRLEHIWLEDGRWQRAVVRPNLAGRPAVAASDGRVVALGSDGAGGLAVVDLADGSRRRITDVPSGWEASYDGQALARFGRLETLVPDGDEPRVVTVELP